MWQTTPVVTTAGTYFVPMLTAIINKLQASGLAVSILIKTITKIHNFNRQNEDPLKAPPTYSYLAPRVAVIFVVTTWLLVPSPFLNVCLMPLLFISASKCMLAHAFA